MALFGAGSIYSVPFTASVTTAGSFDLLGVLAPNNSQVVLRSLTLGAVSSAGTQASLVEIDIFRGSTASSTSAAITPGADPPLYELRRRRWPDRSSPAHPRGWSRPRRRRSCIGIVGATATRRMCILRTPATSRSWRAAMSVRDCMFGCRFRTKPSPWPSNGTWECLLRRPWPGVPARSRDACRYVEERQVSRSADAMRPRETAYRS